MSEQPTAPAGDANDASEVTRRALLGAAAGVATATTAGCVDVTTPASVAEIPTSPNFGYVVSPAWVVDNRDDVTVLDARPAEPFHTARIYGARRVDFDAVTAQRETDRGVVPDATTVAAAFGRAGVSPTDDVVVYGGSVGSRVTRLVYALEYLGHEGDVRVMTGGFEAWTGRVGTGARSVSSVAYDPSPQADRVVTREWLAERLGTFNDDSGASLRLVDVREPEAYLAAPGADALVESNARHGHVPGAVDLHWIGNVSGRQLAKPSELATLYLASAAAVEERDTVVVYGQDNVNATNTYLVLRALGVDDVRLYAGGFREWANVPPQRRDRFPVETKTTAVVETEGDVSGGGGGGFSCTG